MFMSPTFYLLSYIGWFLRRSDFYNLTILKIAIRFGQSEVALLSNTQNLGEEDEGFFFNMVSECGRRPSTNHQVIVEFRRLEDSKVFVQKETVTPNILPGNS